MPVSFEGPAADSRAQAATRAVSVVVRAESAASGVRTTVESALTLARTRDTGTEVVLVHDCADRTTWEWLLELKRAHPELYLIDFGEPYGNQVARLEGARRANHSHVCFAGPGADTDALAHAIREAVPRNRAIAVLREGLGAVAEQRLVLQSFAPGTPGPVAESHVETAPASKSASQHRRAGLLIAASCVFAIAIASVLGLRGQSPPEAAASPGVDQPVGGDVRVPAASSAAAVGAQTWPLEGPVAPDRAAEPAETKPRKKRASQTAPASAVDAESTAAATHVTDRGDDGSTAPASSSEPRPDKNPPAQTSQPAPPTQASAPSETSDTKPAPAASDPAQPVPTEAPPLGTGGDQGTLPPAPNPTTPPAPPPATASDPPSPSPPADQGPGSNGNGHAYGHANGNGPGNTNGQGNGNGPKK